MNRLPSPILVLFLVGLVRAEEVQESLSSAANAAIARILDRAGDKTMEQIRSEIDKAVDGLDEQTQKSHEEWKKQVEQDERARMQRIREALPKLSPQAQQRLIRIVLVQQNGKFTPKEKQDLLKQISFTLDASIQKELSQNLSETDLFSVLY
ncbi:unnamed protein product [Caenorhabditis auriculariae]|uniref:SXP/RAL-2 family protein Ani s 5-like cation-binding domain-containing protein n=1 Tax=Caenorhabditis auriculariae TaxID=2777116 RepID=A0A8S1HV91_9PELO|nr:unnamed protein product [Caenorhabditis auriculariae]